jgi:hypothetical protein
MINLKKKNNLKDWSENEPTSGTSTKTLPNNNDDSILWNMK